MKEHTILLVKDDSIAASHMQQLQTILSYLKYSYQVVTLEQLSDWQVGEGCFVILEHQDATQLTRQISRLRQLSPHLPIILLGGDQQDIDGVMIVDNIDIPLTQASLVKVLHRMTAGNARQKIGAMPAGAYELVGESEAIRDVRELTWRVAKKNINVLLTGESGTGKELAARRIHYFSDRAGGPFVPINCGAIPPELLESELFGHEKGAFTGAITTRKGRFELAAGGTLFLDEIGDMPLAMQVKLLRVLQERTLERVGGSESIQVDVRIITATHCDLEQAVSKGDFREDLFYRINVFPIHIAPLRERMADLPLLLTDLIQRFSSQHGCDLTISESAMTALAQYKWPGNVRELANLVERLMVLAPNDVVRVADLPYKLQQTSPQQPPSVASGGQLVLLTTEGIDLKKLLLDTEVSLIRQALLMSDGVVAKAARLLNIQRTTLVEKMRKYRLQRKTMAALAK